MAILYGSNKADKINGTAQNDTVFGDNGNDVIGGGAGNDRLFGENGDDFLFGGDGDDFLDGGNGNDMLTGGAGNDDIQGGNGQDTLVLSGNRADYRFFAGTNGSVMAQDLRAGSPDGTDRLFNMERVQLADGNFKLADLISSNVAPVAQNDALTLAENAGKTEITSILLANDSDADGDSIVVSSVQAVSAQGAVVTLGPDGKVSYDAGDIFADLDNGETATDSFTYTITDGNGHVSTATATVTITGISSQNSAPVAADDSLTISEDAGPTDVTAALLGNDTDADGDTLTVSAVQEVTHLGAMVWVGADGKVTYHAGSMFDYLEAGETATDSFTYTVTDEHGATSTATATVTITGEAEDEIVPDAYFVVQEDGTSEDMWGDFTENMNFELAEVETDGLLGTLDWDMEGGTLTFTADHESTDALTPDQVQWTYFTAIGTEGERKLIGLKINGSNDQIVAVDDETSLGEGEVSGNLYNLLVGNDVDPDSAVATRRISSVDTSETLGTVTLDPLSRKLSYSAENIDLAPGETRTDTFSYTVTDGWGSSDTATVTVTITGAEGGGASTSMAGGESILSAFLPAGAGGSHLDDAEFAGFPAMQQMQQMQEMLVADAFIG